MRGFSGEQGQHQRGFALDGRGIINVGFSGQQGQHQHRRASLDSRGSITCRLHWTAGAALTCASLDSRGSIDAGFNICT